jgi:putative ABC transport system substrate-binding protein
MIRRREFITLLGGVTAWPVAARAQQEGLPVIGLLLAGAREPQATFVAAFRTGLAEAGFVEGRNVLIEYRYAETRPDGWRIWQPILSAAGSP